MATFYTLAAATVMSVACGAWAGFTPVDVDASSVHIGADHDARFVSVYSQVDCADLLMEGPEVSTTYLTTENDAQNKGHRAVNPTVVSLPPAAPAGLLMFGLFGLVSLARRMRNRNKLTSLG